MTTKSRHLWLQSHVSFVASLIRGMSYSCDLCHTNETKLSSRVSFVACLIRVKSHSWHVSFVSSLNRVLSHSWHVSFVASFIRVMSYSWRVSFVASLIRGMSHWWLVSFVFCLIRVMSHSWHVSFVAFVIGGMSFVIRVMSHTWHVSFVACVIRGMSYSRDWDMPRKRHLIRVTWVTRTRHTNETSCLIRVTHVTQTSSWSKSIDHVTDDYEVMSHSCHVLFVWHDSVVKRDNIYWLTCEFPAGKTWRNRIYVTCIFHHLSSDERCHEWDMPRSSLWFRSYMSHASFIIGHHFWSSLWFSNKQHYLSLR